MLVTIFTPAKVSDAMQWCTDTLPNSAWSIVTKWPAEGITFKFKEEKTAIWFSLKWT